MIKKARDLRPGNVVDGKRIVIVEIDKVEYSGNEIIWIWFTHKCENAIFVSPDTEVWVDEEAPSESEPVSKGTDGPFYTNFFGFRVDYPFSVKSKDTGNVGFWKTRLDAECAANRLNTLFAQRQVVTKRAEDLKIGDKIIVQIDERSTRGGYEDAMGTHFLRPVSFRFNYDEEVQVLR